MRGGCEARRTILRAIGGLALAGLVPMPAAAQTSRFDRVAPMGERAEFDIPGGRFTLLENAAVSERLRVPGANISVRFQMETVDTDARWASLVKFSFASVDGLNELQVTFADLPAAKHLVMSVNRVKYLEPRSSQPVMQLEIAELLRREVNTLAFLVASTQVTVAIGERRWPFPLDFSMHRLLFTASGAKGWVEFIQPPTS